MAVGITAIVIVWSLKTFSFAGYNALRLAWIWSGRVTAGASPTIHRYQNRTAVQTFRANLRFTSVGY